jgi:DNA-binding response OmpR family regulator
MKIAIIEGDPDTVESICLTLSRSLPKCQIVSTNLGEIGIKLVDKESPDIVIIDLELPDMSSFDVLRQIRLFSQVPIIILTTEAAETAKLMAIDMEPYDYIAKPFGQLQLLSLIESRIRDNKLPPKK